jgi:hypothetical protein
MSTRPASSPHTRTSAWTRESARSGEYAATATPNREDGMALDLES